MSVTARSRDAALPLGSGTDTLVVLHGGPGAGMNSVLPAVRPLAGDRVLLLYDQRGGGRSTLPEDTADLRPEDFVRASLDSKTGALTGLWVLVPPRQMGGLVAYQIGECRSASATSAIRRAVPPHAPRMQGEPGLHSPG